MGVIQGRKDEERGEWASKQHAEPRAERHRQADRQTGRHRHRSRKKT